MSWSKPASGLVALLALVCLAGCGDSDRPTLSDPAPGGSTESETTADVVEPTSVASVVIGTRAFDFRVTCFDAGAGDVLAAGAGADATTGAAAELVVQAFLGDPYLQVDVVEGVRFEAALDAALTFISENDQISADLVHFVADLDLESGEGSDAGTGSVIVNCASYEKGLPAGF